MPRDHETYLRFGAMAAAISKRHRAGTMCEYAANALVVFLAALKTGDTSSRYGMI